jgi:hypothetical protein
MKMSFSRRIKSQFMKLTAKTTIAILDRQIAKDTPEQQKQLRKVRRFVILMLKLIKQREKRYLSGQEVDG